MFLYMYTLLSYAQSSADSLYLNGHYEKAIEEYTRLLQVDSLDYRLYYNIGNAYYRLDSVPRAILYYERAYKYNPSDKDVRFNLQYVRDQIDGVIIDEGGAIDRVFLYCAQCMTMFEWGISGFLCFLVAAVFFILYKVKHSYLSVRYFFCGCVICLFLSIFANVMLACLMKQRAKNNAVILQDCSVMTEPRNDGGKKITTLRYGSRIHFEKHSVKVGFWQQVQLPSGEKGWIEKRYMERI